MPRQKKRERSEYYKPRALSEETYVTLTDIKNWLYCPLIVYYNRVLKAKPLTETIQEYGRELHKEEIVKILRRKGIAPWERKIYIIREYETELTSPRLKLKGIIDIIAMNQHGQIFPIEIKYMKSNKGKPWQDHKYQLTAQALLIEENYKKPVDRGYIYYQQDGKTIRIRIDDNDKQYTKHIIKKILEVITTEKPPKTRTPKNKCTGGCGYRWICQI